MKRLLFFLVLLAACKSPHTYGATNGGPPNAVNITGVGTAGGTILGADTALNVAIVSGALADGGTNPGVLVQNDASAPVPVQLQDSGVTVLNTVTADTTGADLALNQRTFNAAITTSGILLDAGTHQLVAFNVYSESVSPQYFQIYCGQVALDAGGTNGAGTVPDYQLPCPGKTFCPWAMPSTKTCGVGGTYYWSTDAGFLSASLGTGGSGTEAVWR